MEITILPTKDETSETIVRNLFSPFLFILFSTFLYILFSTFLYILFSTFLYILGSYSAETGSFLCFIIV